MVARHHSPLAAMIYRVRWVRIVCALAVGLVVSVGVTFPCQYWGRGGTQWDQLGCWGVSATGFWTISRSTGRGYEVYEQHWCISPLGMHTTPPAEGSIPSWLEVPEQEDAGYSRSEAYGLPLKCLVAHAVPATSSGIHLTLRPPMRNGLVMTIPFQPIWTGLLLNTLSFAACVTIAWHIHSLLRRAVRKRRHQCVSCGYAESLIGGAPCPECGYLLATR
jgi:hypothetical protein